MKLIYLKSALKCHSFDIAIGIKISFLRVLVTIKPGHSLLQFVTTNCLIRNHYFTFFQELLQLIFPSLSPQTRNTYTCSNPRSSILPVGEIRNYRWLLTFLYRNCFISIRKTAVEKSQCDSQPREKSSRNYLTYFLYICVE